SQLGREHLILERGRLAERWRSERWDSLTFQFPNWMIELPGYPYQRDDPEGFAPRDEVVRFLEGYAASIHAPLRLGVRVRTLRPRPGSRGFLIETDEAAIEAANVVVATGPYQQPAIPEFGASVLHDVFQVHSPVSRNPEQLPPGAILVVGSGASGCQIAEDLHASGRQVYLSVGTHRRVPRRYRGRDFGWWQLVLGRYDLTADQRPPVRS